jgi:hypothetical protein
MTTSAETSQNDSSLEYNRLSKASKQLPYRPQSTEHMDATSLTFRRRQVRLIWKIA